MLSAALPIIPQGLETLRVQGLSMSSETNPVCQLGIVILKDFNIEEALKTCMKIAKDKNVIFQGMFFISVFSQQGDGIIMGNAQQLNFVANLDLMNTIIKEVKTSLNIADENFTTQITLPQASPEPTPSTMSPV